jgi:hypothetical protein
MKKGSHMTDEQRSRLSASCMGRISWSKGLKMSDESKRKNSIGHMGQHAWNKGVPMTDEQKAVNSASHKGLVESPEHRAKISAAGKGRIVSLETRAKLSAALANPSPETREKMSASKMGHAYWGREHLTAEMRAKRLGPLNWHWMGGQTMTNRRQDAKRRTLGFVELNAPFDGCESHHVDNEQVINIPKALHRSVWHNQHTGQGMAKINALAYNFLFKQEVEAAFEAFDANVKAA